MAVIKSISYDQEEIIQNILELHVPSKRIDLDATYSKGNFYKKGISAPKYKFDIKPQTEDTTEACATNLPLPDDVDCNCIMFDPPFVMGSGPSVANPKEGSNQIITRFSCFRNPEQLLAFYNKALSEFYRILNENGVLIFKCQDCVISGKNLMSHVIVMNQAYNIGFYPKDLFILTAKARLISGKVKNQIHARKFHSYFWVFEKRKSKVDYDFLTNI